MVMTTPKIFRFRLILRWIILTEFISMLNPSNE